MRFGLDKNHNLSNHLMIGSEVQVNGHTEQKKIIQTDKEIYGPNRSCIWIFGNI